MRKHVWWAWGFVLLLGCGRYYVGPIRPAPQDQQGRHMVVMDDGSVTFLFERLEVGLRPMSDGELNRQFPGQSSKGATSTNPYTYGNWKPMGEQQTPSKYSVWRVKVKNYAYPKVRLNPENIELISTEGYRRYRPLDPLVIREYFYSFIQGYAGNEYARFRQRDDILRRTLFTEQEVFSGQEAEGFVVFPKLDPDVTSFVIHVRDIVLRFDFRNEPIETIDLAFRFEREVFQGFHPPPSLAADL